MHNSHSRVGRILTPLAKQCRSFWRRSLLPIAWNEHEKSSSSKNSQLSKSISKAWLKGEGGYHYAEVYNSLNLSD